MFHSGFTVSVIACRMLRMNSELFALLQPERLFDFSNVPLGFLSSVIKFLRVRWEPPKRWQFGTCVSWCGLLLPLSCGPPSSENAFDILICSVGFNGGNGKIMYAIRCSFFVVSLWKIYIWIVGLKAPGNYFDQSWSNQISIWLCEGPKPSNSMISWFFGPIISWMFMFCPAFSTFWNCKY